MSLEIYTLEAKERQLARARVASLAKEGRRPSTIWSADDLAWAFEGSEEWLAELEQEAQAIHDRDVQRQQEKRERDKIEWVTKKVLAEWDEEEKRARYKQAQAEARKRLGLS